MNLGTGIQASCRALKVKMTPPNAFSSGTKIGILLCTIAIVVAIYFIASPRDVLSDVNGIFRLSTSKTSLTRIVFSAKVNTNDVIASVDERFLSVCLTWRRRDAWKFDSVREKRLITLTKGLAPAYVRIGGTPSDFVIFQSSSKPYGKQTVNIGEKDLDRIDEIADNAGWQVLFALSVLKRFNNGSWDSSNPYQIVKYVAEKGYNFGWELGNGEYFSCSISTGSPSSRH